MSFDQTHPFLADIKKQPQPTIHYSPNIPSPDDMEGIHKNGSPEDTSINIVHSAILESEDEAGYRQFIGEVAGGTVGLGLGHGYGLGMRWINQ
jgi:hypothetical protein